MNPNHRPRIVQTDADEAMNELLLQLLGKSGDDHLTYDQLEALVDRQLSPVDRASLESHLTECPACRADLEHLREVAVHMSPAKTLVAFEPRMRPIWTRRVQWAGAAAAVLVAAVLLWPETSPMRLTDTGRTITVEPGGTLTGLGSVSEAAESAVATAVRLHRLEIPGPLGQGTGTLMGGTSTANETLVSPLGAVIDDRPAFEWRGEGGGREYSVYVFDLMGREVARSAASLRERSWTPNEPLPRSQVLSWQVVARDDGREQVFPAPPAAEARFRVLATTEIEVLETARRSSDGSHLVMGVMYARAGLLREARRELEALAAANPSAELPRSLLASLPPEP